MFFLGQVSWELVSFKSAFLCPLSGGWLGGLALGWFLLAVGAARWAFFGGGVCTCVAGSMGRWIAGWSDGSKRVSRG